MAHKIVGWYSAGIGISVITMWIFILADGSQQEGMIQLSFHLVSEFIMALLCIYSGILLIKGRRTGIPFNLLALGMVTYSVLNAAGYYGGKDEKPMLTLFVLLFVLTVSAIVLHFGRNASDKVKQERA